MGRTLTAVALLGCLASKGSAGDLVLGAESDLWFDDNVYGTSSAATSDFSWSVGPTVELSESWSKLRGSIAAKPAYELYFDEDRLSGFNYDASGDLEWSPTARTTVAVVDAFQRYRTLRGFDPGGGAQPPVISGRERYLRNVAQLTVDHRLSQIDTLRASTTYTLWRFERPDRPDQTSTSASLQYHRLVTPFTRLGGLLSFSRQAFDYGNGTESQTDYFNGSATFAFIPAETFSIEASVGPTWVRRPTTHASLAGLTRRHLIRVSGSGVPLIGILGTCPLLASGSPYDGPGCQFAPFPLPTQLQLLQLSDPMPLIGARPDTGSDDWTYFASVALVKQWTRASIELSYTRDQGEGSALTSSSVADTVRLSGTYELLPRFTVTLTTSWTDRKETQDLGAGRFVTVLGTLPTVSDLVPVGLAAAPVRSTRSGVRSLSTSLGGNYRITERLTLRGLVGWTDQNAKVGSGFGDLSRWFVTFGFDYEFEPLRW